MLPSSVSVILPTYNESGHILDLIHSIINYIPAGWQYNILIVDDNSPDHTYNLVKEFYAGDPRVIPILREKNRGLAK
jgi:dolichol-phosphate mannosyltransferase